MFSNSYDPEDSNTDEEQTADGENIAYHPEYEVELGTTVVTDKMNGQQHTMWKATVTDTHVPSEEDSEDTEYLGEHPADAVLGVLEKASGGVL